jgi:hypothetical protein
MKVVDLAGMEMLLRQWAGDNHTLLVSVDGLPASGKSTFCAHIASSLSADHIPVDSFVDRGMGEYVPHLRPDDLRNRLRSAEEAGGIVLVDGICIEAVLQRIDIAPARRLYVMQLDSRSDWIDGELFSSDLTEDGAVVQEQELAPSFGGSLSPRREEIIRYHFRFTPQDMADAVYAHYDAPEA